MTQVFGSLGRVDFWIQFPATGSNNIGWAIELLRDGDRAGEHQSRFLPGGSYTGMPFSQSDVIDFRSAKKQTHVHLPGMVYVHFSDDFRTAFVCSSQKTKLVSLVDV